MGNWEPWPLDWRPRYSNQKAWGVPGIGRFPRIADAIAVHGAVEIDAGYAVAMRLEDAFDHGLVIDVGGAFVMDHDVVALGVIGIAVDGDGRLGARILLRGVAGINDVDLDVGAFLEAVLEDVFLGRVVVAATAGDEKDLERLERDPRQGLRRR